MSIKTVEQINNVGYVILLAEEGADARFGDQQRFAGMGPDPRIVDTEDLIRKQISG
ncbi:hypothetical protein [Corynebacterium glutamicum]|uniref:hypothetical protein n=1 Tax=Corynebacterium glutamicum TaxID=1718 RepID=UPI002158A5B6|nr:hypothetical protein [Corynebacterium glutamicum]